MTDDLDPDARCSYVRPDGSQCGNAHWGNDQKRCRYHDHGSWNRRGRLIRELADLADVMNRAALLTGTGDWFEADGVNLYRTTPDGPRIKMKMPEPETAEPKREPMTLFGETFDG